MTQLIATFVCIAGIAWLFYLDRDANPQPSNALWIPTVWLLINSSRSVSSWFHLVPSVSLVQQYTEGSPMDAVIFAVLTAAGVVMLNFRARSVREFIRSNLPLLVFFCFCALSVTWSDEPVIALKRFGKSVGDLVMVMVVLTDPYPRIAIRKLFTRAAFVLLPLSVLFIKYYPSLGTAYSAEDLTTTYVGVTTFKNLLGMISMVFGLTSLWSLMDACEGQATLQRMRRMLAHTLILVIAIWLIVAANSMTSLACLSLAGLLMLAVSQEWLARRRGGIGFAISATVLLPILMLFDNNFGFVVHSLGRNATLTGRTVIWKAVLSQDTNPFVGAGFESFWLGSRLENVWHMSVNGIQEAHNGYLEVYLNLGWIGLILLGWVVLSGYRRAIVTFMSAKHENRLRIAFLTAALVFSMTEAGFRMLSPIWFAFLLASASSPVKEEVTEGNFARDFVWMRFGRLRQIKILQ